VVFCSAPIQRNRVAFSRILSGAARNAKAPSGTLCTRVIRAPEG